MNVRYSHHGCFSLIVFLVRLGKWHAVVAAFIFVLIFVIDDIEFTCKYVISPKHSKNRI